MLNQVIKAYIHRKGQESLNNLPLTYHTHRLDEERAGWEDYGSDQEPIEIRVIDWDCGYVDVVWGKISQVENDTNDLIDTSTTDNWLVEETE